MLDPTAPLLNPAAPILDPTAPALDPTAPVLDPTAPVPGIPQGKRQPPDSGKPTPLLRHTTRGKPAENSGEETFVDKPQLIPLPHQL